MQVKFLDGQIKEFDKNISSREIANSISPSLAKKCICAKINNELYDLDRPINLDEFDFELILKDSKLAFEILNHSCSHLMSCAIKNIYKDAIFGVGPAIEEGFYYDFLSSSKVSEADLVLIEKEMERIINLDVSFIRREVSKEEALAIFKFDVFKLELIKDLEGVITVYSLGDFIDLCKGPHIPSIKLLKNFKLLSISGAYWRGDSKNEQLQRIYGTCFYTSEELVRHLEILKEREARDHRKLGKELELFMISEYGPGFPFWLPNGMILRRTLEKYWYDVHIRENYKLIQTPIMLNKELWEISGHWNNYKNNMYTSEIDNHEFAIKPMNCPGGILVYKNGLHSYKDLPIKIGELGLVHRHEASGALAGLFRVRNFTQDDAHIFLTENQIIEEVSKLIKLYDEFYKVFNLKYSIELSTRPEDKYIGTKESWEVSQQALINACSNSNVSFKINEGDGAFYGPKLDFKLKDSMNRIWQCGTIQLDVNLPERFELSYIDEKGERKRPIMLHRAIFGSIERFIGILIEHFGGAFPTWLAPVQVVLIPVNNNFHLEFVHRIKDILLRENIRVEIDKREEKLGYKIRDAQTKKIPYQLVCGDKEVETSSLNIRKYGSEKQEVFSIEDFVLKIKNEIKSLK